MCPYSVSCSLPGHANYDSSGYMAESLGLQTVWLQPKGCECAQCVFGCALLKPVCRVHVSTKKLGLLLSHPLMRVVFPCAGSAARLAAKAAEKKARGWSGADAEDALPDADLLTFEFGLFQVGMICWA